MIEEASGDLLRADVDALVNTVNTVGVAGKGVALQFRQAFPDNYAAYRTACKRGEVVIGRMHVFDNGQLTRPRLIVNFPTKEHWRSRSRLTDIVTGLDDLVRVVREHRIASLAVPPLGCGNGGLDWHDVRPRIVEALGRLDDVRVLLYPPGGVPPAASMRVATPKPAMTAGRAALIALLDGYGEAGLGASPLEVQKLLYLLQVAGEPLRLDFAKGRYGPYAEAVNHVLRTVEGHHLRGFGDRSRSVHDAEPLELVDGAADEADAFLADHSPTRERVQQVRQLVEGFESPYGLELLATVHWVATREDPAAADDADAALRLVQSWSRRKGRLFTARHIDITRERLREQGWLNPAALAPAPA